MNQQYVLSEMSTSRNTHTLRLCVNWLMEMLCAHGTLALFFPKEKWFCLPNSVFVVML